MKSGAVMKHRGVTVSIYGPLPDRKREVYLLAYYVGSRREKQTCKGTLEEAKKKAKEIANGLGSGDIIDGLHLTPLDRRVYITAKQTAAPLGRAVDQLCREASEALVLLGAGATLTETVRFWQKHHSGELPSAMPGKVVEELYAWLAGKRRSATTVRTLRSIYDRFIRDFQMPIAHITRDDLDRWLAEHLSHRPRTIRNYRSALVRLFNFAKGRYLPAEVPSAAERLEAPSDDNQGAVEIFRPWELEKILQFASTDLRPCIALGAFAGVRTIELCRLEWSAIHFADEAPGDTSAPGFVEVSAAAAKQHRTAARRIVPMQPNLSAWLEPYRFRSGRISPYRNDRQLSDALTDLVRSINRAEKKARRPEVSRPKNGLRHSYGSYRLPVIGSVAGLALEMNNSPAEIIENYREVVYPRDVEAWWKIAPRAAAEIIQLELLG